MAVFLKLLSDVSFGPSWLLLKLEAGHVRLRTDLISPNTSQKVNTVNPIRHWACGQHHYWLLDAIREEFIGRRSIGNEAAHPTPMWRLHVAVDGYPAGRHTLFTCILIKLADKDDCKGFWSRFYLLKGDVW